ncbi:hypothetical protein PYCCODRAFT_1384679 [Trametes coccinea BRFM310]|uniref:Aminoglycoside phosphotransferase domain-containing protein n=1 Tax=Trametes coccinea (strain BRFM310) TaxID=1353009 RepID=A0A1Y2IX70_TRAC3|nr:hypothetical protein PYCCODRAFT_1384679 [Trametes coccinea BRFM310]
MMLLRASSTRFLAGNSRVGFALHCYKRRLHIGPEDEHEFFSVTKTRWLYNDEKQRAIRYVPFNVEAFVDTAIQAADAQSCVSMKKVHEDMVKRIFALNFDNGKELIAKIPFPTSGPKHLCTASEVATLDYLRNCNGIPVPDVRAWCSRADSSPVGTEYIMYEKMQGVPLLQHDRARLDAPIWEDAYIAGALPLVQRLETYLHMIPFAQIGSLYYKEDVDESLRDRPLYKVDMPPSMGSERFCIGPTVDREFWRAGRAALDIDRGPWPDMHSYMRALASCARASIDAFPPEPSTKAKYHQLISDYEKLIPHISPEQRPYVLWHPDLNARNIIVTESSEPCAVVGFVDWQGAIIAPDHLQLQIPPAYEAEEHPMVNDGDGTAMPSLRPEADALEGEEKQSVQLALRRLQRKKMHELYVRENEPELGKEMYDTLCSPGRRLVTLPGQLIARGVEDGLAAIEKSFLIVRAMWSMVAEVDEKGVPVVEFPIDISDAEAKRIQEEVEQRAQDEEMADPVLAMLGIMRAHEGEVPAEQYEVAKSVVEGARQALLNAAPTLEEKERRARAWPLQDGKHSDAERCW